MHTLDLEQVRLFLGEARRSSRYYRLYLAAVTTGARQGELLGLRWKDCDLVGGRAAITQTFYRLGGSTKEGTKAQQLFKAPKTGGSRRSVPLASELLTELLALREEQREQKRRLGDRYHDLDLVFCQQNGRPLHAHNVVQRDFRAVLVRARLPRVRFHDLRHSTATLHLARGIHPKIVAGLLGHSSVQVTLDTYSHAIPALEEDATRKLGALLVTP